MLDVTNYGNTGKLGGAVTATQTVLPLVAGTGNLFSLAASTHYWLTIRSGAAMERVKVTARVGDTLVVAGRGMDGTTATAWNANACLSVEWNPTQLCEFVQQCTAGIPLPSSVTPGTFCLDKCTCITVDATGRITNINKGTSC